VIYKQEEIEIIVMTCGCHYELNHELRIVVIRRICSKHMKPEDKDDRYKNPDSMW
jgi:hypothetical protein